MRKTVEDEAGQVLAFTLVCMVVLIAMVGFAVDVGHAYLVQRQLQSGVDAAALAGAQELPDPTLVTTMAENYGPNSTKNPPTAIDNAVTNVEMKCVTTAPGCSSSFNTYNAVKVTATSNVKTYFARILGIDSLKVNATATACSPCSAKPLDIMIVLDRTGSMCDVSSGGKCRDLNNAIVGINTFLQFMDPALDEVGLAVFPPSLTKSGYCNAPTSGGKNYGYNAFWPNWGTPPFNESPAFYAIASPDFDYTPITQRLACLKAAGTTSYVDSIDEAQHELERQGRGNVRNVIIFVSDGAANETPRWYPSYIPTSHVQPVAQPCTQGIDAANHVKSTGTIIYTIGYDVDADSNGGRCGNEGLTAKSTLQQMASDKDNYYDQPDPKALGFIFTQIAADISRPASRLIPD